MNRSGIRVQVATAMRRCSTDGDRAIRLSVWCERGRAVGNRPRER